MILSESFGKKQELFGFKGTQDTEITRANISRVGGHHTGAYGSYTLYRGEVVFHQRREPRASPRSL